MLKKTIYKVVDWMGAAMRPSFFVFLSITLIAACSGEVQEDGQSSDQSLRSAPALTIYRDEYGTPHVVADSNYGVYFGYGYAVATDRLFQMEMLRRTVRGRVAEVLGSQYLDLDKHVRTAFDHRAVTAQLGELKHQDREILEAYADGFSKRVNEVLLNQSSLLAKEFVDFDFLPQTWDASDVAMIFIGSIIHRYSDFNSEMDNLGLLNSLAALHGEEKAGRIFNASKWLTDPTSPTTVPRGDKTAAASLPGILPDRPLSKSYTRRVVLDDRGRFAGTTDDPAVRSMAESQIAVNGYSSPEFSPASNFWAVGGEKLSDADGALVNGPQFAFGLPSYVYGIGLHGGDFNVVGNTLLGLPTLLFAHNNSVSWGSTAGMSDQVDVFREQLVEGKPGYYRHDGVDKAFETWTETINVRDAAPVKVMARRSVHGMVVSMDADNGVAYTRARAWEGGEVKTLVAWVNLARDKTMDAVQSRLAAVAANINFYYMDVQGNLGYTHGGRYPERADSHDSRLPGDGTGSDDWLGFRPYSDNPTVRNPQQGFIVNWNNRPAAGWLASDLWPQTWSKADRVIHITEELSATQTLTTDDVWAINERISYDDVSASFLFPYLDKAMSDADPAPTVTSAYKLVQQWDREWRLEEGGHYGAAELIVETWLQKLFKQVLSDDIGEEKFSMYSATKNPNHPIGASMGSSVGVKVILRNLDALADGSDSYDFFNGANPDRALLDAFSSAVQSLVTEFGEDMTQWLLAPAPMTWRPYNFRGVPQAAEDALLTLPAYMNRGSENNFFIARNGEFIAYDVIPPGQSGFVAPDGQASPHAADQMDLYADFKYKTIPFSLEQVKKAAVQTETVEIPAPAAAKSSFVTEAMRRTLEKARMNENLAAFIYLDEDKAMAAARAEDKRLAGGGKRGMLSGIPIAVKDNTHVAGMPNSAGTPSLKNFFPEKNNPAVQRLVNEGAIILGKTNMHELAFGITSNNSAFGAVRNARDPSRIAGGSSGGTAAAVAAGIVEMGLGTDTGGSTRIPPALNGVVGFRPSMGRYPAGGVTPISSTRDTVGPIANNVSNAALLDCVIMACDSTVEAADLGGLRLGIPREYFYANLSAAVDDVMQETLQALTTAGAVLVEVDMPGLEEANNGVSFPVVLYEFIRELPAYLEDNGTGLSLQQVAEAIASPDVKATVLSQMGEQAMPEEAYIKAIKEARPRLQSLYRTTFEQNNIAALLVPATPLTATPVDDSDETVELNGERVPTFPTFIRNTDPTSNAGLPSLTLPAGTDEDGLPVGIMLDGPFDSDRQLLSIGLAIEKLSGYPAD